MPDPFFSTGSEEGSRLGLGGKIVLLLIFLLMTAFGLLGSCASLATLVKKTAARGWEATPCEILASEVQENLEAEDYGFFRFSVRYAYEVAGTRRTSTQYAIGQTATGDYAEAARLADRFRAGTEARCFVDPADPNESILVREWPWTETLFAPMCFVLFVVGVLGLYLLRRRERVAALWARIEAAFDRKDGWKRAALIIFSVFILLGGMGLACLLGPIFRIVEARGRPETPCTVLVSRVRPHGGEQTAYSPFVFYRYRVGGKEYKSSRYKFSETARSEYRDSKEVVDRLPPGTETVCYVNPEDPFEAVIERGMTFGDTLAASIVLLFFVVGIGGLFFTLRSLLRRRDARAPSPLSPRAGRVYEFLTVTGLALLWNGFLFVFVRDAVKGWAAGEPDVLFTIFLVPFVLLGVSLLVAVLYMFLRIFRRIA